MDFDIGDKVYIIADDLYGTTGEIVDLANMGSKRGWVVKCRPIALFSDRERFLNMRESELVKLCDR